MKLVQASVKEAVYPFQKIFPFYVLIETQSSFDPASLTDNKEGKDPDLVRIFNVFDKASASIVDAVVA